MRNSVWKKPTILLLFIGFLNLFLFHEFGATALALVFAGFYVFFACLFFSPDERYQPKTLLASGTYLALLLLFLITPDNGFVKFVVSLGGLITLALLLYTLSTHIPFIRSLLEGLLVPLNLVVTYIRGVVRALEKILTSKPSQSKTHLHTDRFKPLLVGLAMGIPVVFALVILLSGADPIYAKFIKDIFSFKWPAVSDRLVARLVFSLFWLAFLTPLLFFRRKKEFQSPLAVLEKTNFVREMTVVMILIAITLASFLLVQAPYIFASVSFETDLSKFGVATYSEYVSRGFGELIFISIFIYFLTWLGLLFLRGKSKSDQGILKYAQLVVLAEFGIFLISLFRRIWLYQMHHGWSLVRIYGGLFLIWITAIAITLLLRHFFTRRWVVVEAVLTMTMIAFVGLFNAENFIATTHPPTVNKRVDFVYLSRMSADGYVGWQKAYDYAEDILVNKNLQQKELINRDERREIAYAGTIVNNLTDNYLNLIRKYGTLDKWKEYQREVYDYLSEISGQEIVIHEPNPRITKQLYSEEQIEKTKKEIETKILELDQLQDKTTDIQLTHYHFAHSFQSEFSVCHGQQSAYCHRSWYAFDQPYRPRELDYKADKWDVLFSWNGAQSSAYQKMNFHMSHQNLLKLQKQYFDLYYKILSQSPSEREYDVDISFRTPFL